MKYAKRTHRIRMECIRYQVNTHRRRKTHGAVLASAANKANILIHSPDIPSVAFSLSGRTSPCLRSCTTFYCWARAQTHTHNRLYYMHRVHITYLAPGKAHRIHKQTRTRAITTSTGEEQSAHLSSAPIRAKKKHRHRRRRRRRRQFCPYASVSCEWLHVCAVLSTCVWFSAKQQKGIHTADTTECVRFPYLFECATNSTN